MMTDKRLDLIDERLNSHGQRIQELEKKDEEKHQRLDNIEQSFNRLEGIVTKQNEETRETMTSQTDKLFNLVEQSMGQQETRELRQHELKMAKVNTWSTVFLKISGGIVGLLSSGGIIYLVIEKLLSL